MLKMTEASTQKALKKIGIEQRIFILNLEICFLSTSKDQESFLELSRIRTLNFWSSGVEQNSSNLLLRDQYSATECNSFYLVFEATGKTG